MLNFYTQSSDWEPRLVVNASPDAYAVRMARVLGGASLAASLLMLGRIEGVKRPVIASPLPRSGPGMTTLLDGGANVDSKPEYLVQSAIMGEIYSREVLGIIHPAIGIMSNGEEDNKGNELTQEVFSVKKTSL